MSGAAVKMSDLIEKVLSHVFEGLALRRILQQQFSAEVVAKRFKHMVNNLEVTSSILPDHPEYCKVECP